MYLIYRTVLCMMDQDCEQRCFSKAVHCGVYGVQIRSHSFSVRRLCFMQINVLDAGNVSRYVNQEQSQAEKDVSDVEIV